VCKHVRRGQEEPVNKAGECHICRNASLLKKAGIKVGNRNLVFEDPLSMCSVLFQECSQRTTCPGYFPANTCPLPVFRALFGSKEKEKANVRVDSSHGYVPPPP